MNGALIIVDVIDLGAAIPINALDPSTISVIVAKARVGWWDGAHGGPPCCTWSRVLHRKILEFRAARSVGLRIASGHSNVAAVSQVELL